jgi:hypothetical protein
MSPLSDQSEPVVWVASTARENWMTVRVSPVTGRAEILDSAEKRRLASDEGEAMP